MKKPIPIPIFTSDHFFHIYIYSRHRIGKLANNLSLRLMLGLHRIMTNLRPIYELRNYGFLGLVSSRKLLSSDRKLAFTSIPGGDWHTSKQKVYNWPSNNSDLRPRYDRLASSRPSHAIRKSIGITSGPRTTTTARPPWYTCDRPPTDLWCFATDWRPTYNLGAIASSYLCHSPKVCMR